MPEENGLIFPEKPFADQVDQAGRGAPGIDRVQQQGFLLRKKLDRFYLCSPIMA